MAEVIVEGNSSSEGNIITQLGTGSENMDADSVIEQVVGNDPPQTTDSDHDVQLDDINCWLRPKSTGPGSGIPPTLITPVGASNTGTTEEEYHLPTPFSPFSMAGNTTRRENCLSGTIHPRQNNDSSGRSGTHTSATSSLSRRDEEKEKTTRKRVREDSADSVAVSEASYERKKKKKPKHKSSSESDVSLSGSEEDKKKRKRNKRKKKKTLKDLRTRFKGMYVPITKKEKNERKLKRGLADYANEFSRF